MLHPSLLTYIKSARAKDMATAVIRSNLVGAGWNEDEVDAAIIQVLSNHSDESSHRATFTQVAPFSYAGVALIGVAVFVLGIIFGQACFWLVQPRVSQSVSSAVSPASASPTNATLLISGTNQVVLADVPTPLPSSTSKTKPVPKVTVAPTPTATIPFSNL